MSMARRTVSLEEKIENAETIVITAKAKYEKHLMSLGSY